MLFSRKSERRNEPSPAPPSTQERASSVQQPTGSGISPDGMRTQSYIDASLTIVGDLHADGDVRIDGRICGNVRCAQLIVGKDAAVTGAVTAEETIVRGRMVGTIRSPVVIIQDTAHVESEITYKLLAIDHGATFDGAVHRRDNPLEGPLEGPLEEVDAAAPLLELQQVALAAEGSPSASGTTASNRRDASTETAAVAPPAVLDASATNGRAPRANGHGGT